MRDGFLEIDMVLRGLSVVSNVGFKPKKTWGSEIGAERLEMQWKYFQHLQKSGGIGAHLFQSCLLLFVNISSICLLGKGFAPLRCTRTVKAPWGLWNAVDGLWLLHAHGAGGEPISLTVWFFVCNCSSVLWPRCGKHLTSSVVCTFLQQLEWRWKASYRHFVLAPACGNYTVKRISGILNVSFTSAHRSRSMWNETGLCFA